MANHRSDCERIASDPWNVFNDVPRNKESEGEIWDRNLILWQLIERQEKKEALARQNSLVDVYGRPKSTTSGYYDPDGVNQAEESASEHESASEPENANDLGDTTGSEDASGPETTASHSMVNPYLDNDDDDGEFPELHVKPYCEQESYRTENKSQVDTSCELDNASDAGSSDYGDSDAKSEPIKEEEPETEPETEESCYLDEGPDDFTTGLFDIKNTNPVVEDAILYFQYAGVDRPCLEHEMGLKELLDEQREEYYNPPPTPPEGEEPKVSELPDYIPAFNPLYDEIKAKRATKKIGFGGTRVIRFKASHAVVEDGSKVANDKQPGKSILKTSDGFVTPNHDYELVGDDELIVAIARLFNLCDMPLEFLNKNKPVSSLKRLATGVANAFKSQELCWSHMGEEALRVRDKAIKNQEKSIEELKLEKDSLATEVAELKQKNSKLERELENEVSENSRNKRLAEERQEKWLDTHRESEGRRLNLVTANIHLESVNKVVERLREDLKKCYETIEEGNTKEMRLRMDIKQLDLKLADQRRCVLNKDHRISFLQRYMDESFVLQRKVNDLEGSNKQLACRYNSLQEENDDLLQHLEFLETSLARSDQESTASKQREANVAKANKRLAKQLEESYANIRRLVETNTACKAKFRLKYEEIQEKYSQMGTDCHNRRNEIEKTKLEIGKMGEELKETREKMERRREDNTVDICSDNMVICESPTNVQPADDKHVKGRHRTLRSLANKMYSSSPVISVGEV